MQCPHDDDPEPDRTPDPAEQAWTAIGEQLMDRWGPQLGDARTSDGGATLTMGWRGPVPTEVRELIDLHGGGVVVLEQVDTDDPGGLAAQVVADRALARGLGVQQDHAASARVLLELEQADRIDEVRRIADEVGAAHGVRVGVGLETS